MSGSSKATATKETSEEVNGGDENVQNEVVNGKVVEEGDEEEKVNENKEIEQEVEKKKKEEEQEEKIEEYDRQAILAHKFLDDSSELSELDDSEAETERLDLDLLEEEIKNGSEVVEDGDVREKDDEEEEKSAIHALSLPLREVEDGEADGEEDIEAEDEHDDDDYVNGNSKKRRLSDYSPESHKRNKIENEMESENESSLVNGKKEDDWKPEQIDQIKEGDDMVIDQDLISEQKSENENKDQEDESAEKFNYDINNKVSVDSKSIDDDDEDSNEIKAENEVENEPEEAENKSEESENKDENESIKNVTVETMDKIRIEVETETAVEEEADPIASAAQTGTEHEPEGDEADEADADQEDDNDDQDRDDLAQKRRQEAVTLLTEIEIDFAKIRDQLHQDKMSRYIAEIEMCADGSHPELEHVYSQIDHIRDEKLRLAKNRRNYQRQCISRVSTAMRTQAHQQFLKDQADSRVKLLLRTTEEWYKVNRERRAMDALVPEYSFAIPESRGTQIRQRTTANQEIAILGGVSRYIGFPAAPEMKPINEDELQEDLDALGIPRY